ncbi:MAG: hypothetical protein Aurels2KO_48160 [Aureliella sp.]
MHVEDTELLEDESIVYAIGSHLAEACFNPDSEVWGAGFIGESMTILGSPGRIHAVRGWQSLERLRGAGVCCPDVVGDPALLLPLYYQPKSVKKRYRLGVISHCRESDIEFFHAAKSWPDTLIIDITGGIERVVDQVSSCEFVASSSLHGLICSDGYGVPSLWIQASNRLKGDGFKFRDYFSSVNRDSPDPMAVCGQTTHKDLLIGDYELGDRIDWKTLLHSCPFWNGMIPPFARTNESSSGNS